jgi:UDP-glucose 4-epimerase
MASYLITGGAGFIGSHLAESLVRDGHRVRVLDNLSSGRIENLPRGVELIVDDVTRADAVRQALEGVDGCFHLAAIASVDYYRKDWLRSHTVNLGGTIAVFEEAVRAQHRRGRPLPVVYASSAAVYGYSRTLPIAETSATRPLSAYGVDKLGCELHAATAATTHDLASVGLRLFNVYGPRQDPNSPYSGVISIFCRRILEHATIEIHGDGTQARDFVFVGDAVNAFRGAMRAARGEPQILNVCTGTGTTVRELAQIIAELGNVRLQARYLPSRAGDIHLSIGDPSLAREALGFAAAIPLRAGLALTLASIVPHTCREARTDLLIAEPRN